MASRKQPDGPGLFAVPPPPPSSPVYVKPPPAPMAPVISYSPTANEEIAVEPNGDGTFWVHLVRDNGTTRAAVRYTRTQLEMLMRRIPAALEMGR